MSRSVACVALAALGVVSGSEGVNTQAPTLLVRSTNTRPAATIWTTHPLLQARLNGIARRSALWRHAFDALAGTGRRAIVVTSDEVVVADDPYGQPVGAFDNSVLAEIAPVPALMPGSTSCWWS